MSDICLLSDEECVELFQSKESFSMRTVVELLFAAIMRCEVPPNSTWLFHRNGVYIDVVQRNSIAIVMQRCDVKLRDDDCEHTDGEEDTDRHTDEENTNTDEKDAQKEVDANPWTVVERGATTVQRMPIFCFCTEANALHMDFVGEESDVTDIHTHAAKYKWYHAYDTNQNKVYDYCDASNREYFRTFVPNEYYKKKFQKWYKGFVENGCTQVPDTRKFYVFKENSYWPSWTLITTVEGLTNVRNTLHDRSAHYGHAYCKETEEVYDYTVQNKRIFDTIQHASEEYKSKINAVLAAQTTTKQIQ